MIENQKGFSAIEGLIVLVIVGLLGLTGWYVYSNHQTHEATGGNRSNQKSLAYKSEHYGLYLTRSVNDDFVGSYNLVVSFNDSIDPEAQCPTVQKDFKGNVGVSKLEVDSAEVTITQNEKPHKISEGLCAVEADSPYENKYTFDKSWLENTKTAKKLKIQGKTYTLQIDKQAYVLVLSGDRDKKASVAYIPDGIGGLYPYPNCKSQDELKSFAKSNGIELAETKYPNIEQKLFLLDRSERNTNQYNQSLLIIANDFVKDLLKQKGVDETCKIWASNTPVGATLGSNIRIE